jgi:hypothetical protein
MRVIHDQGPFCIVLGKRWVDMMEVKPYRTRIEDYAEFDKLLLC